MLPPGVVVGDDSVAIVFLLKPQVGVVGGNALACDDDDEDDDDEGDEDDEDEGLRSAFCWVSRATTMSTAASSVSSSTASRLRGLNDCEDGEKYGILRRISLVGFL